jgi:hypothetical protein
VYCSPPCYLLSLGSKYPISTLFLTRIRYVVPSGSFWIWINWSINNQVSFREICSTLRVQKSMDVPRVAGTDLYFYLSVCNAGLRNCILRPARYVQYSNCISLFKSVPNATDSINGSNTFISLIKVTNFISWIGLYFEPFCLVHSHTLLLLLSWNCLRDALVVLAQNVLVSFSYNMADHRQSDGNTCRSRPSSLSISLNITCTPLTFCHSNMPPAVQVTTLYVIISVHRFSNGTGMILYSLFNDAVINIAHAVEGAWGSVVVQALRY